MNVEPVDEEPLAAGDFSSWVVETRGAIRGERDADVACNGCTGCCTSSQFVHIEPDEVDTLAHIPVALQFRAPRMPRGHVLLGYDERGHCPMLVENRCSIYEHRPRTCRTYDCRVFAAAGVDPGEGKEAIALRARRWVFAVPNPDDRTRREAVRVAAAYLQARPDLFQGGVAPNPTGLAVVAVELSELFLHRDDVTGATTIAMPDADTVRAALVRAEEAAS